MPNESTMCDSCSSQEKTNSDTTYSTISHVTCSATTDVPAKNHIDDGIIGNVNAATTDEPIYEKMP